MLTNHVPHATFDITLYDSSLFSETIEIYGKSARKKLFLLNSPLHLILMMISFALLLDINVVHAI